jgi:hypothetical protein
MDHGYLNHYCFAPFDYCAEIKAIYAQDVFWRIDNIYVLLVFIYYILGNLCKAHAQFRGIKSTLCILNHLKQCKETVKEKINIRQRYAHFRQANCIPYTGSS